jgi:hypothetical protein
VNSVAAKIAEEVGVFFEDLDAASGASEQQSRHHAGGSTANDDQVQI